MSEPKTLNDAFMNDTLSLTSDQEKALHHYEQTKTLLLLKYGTVCAMYDAVCDDTSVFTGTELTACRELVNVYRSKQNLKKLKCRYAEI